MKTKLMKSVTLILLAVMLIGITIPVASASYSPFSDVSTSSPAFNAIRWAHANGIVTGSGGRFFPDDNMTRAQYALVLWRYEGRPVPVSVGRFSDVSTTNVAYNAITWANENRIVTGTGDMFLPENNMTRAQMVLMMYRYNNLKGRNSTSNADALDRFTDRGQIVPAAVEAMKWAVTHGLMTGGGSRLTPNDNITRAQVVLILFRYVNAFVGPTPVLPPITQPPQQPETPPVQEPQKPDSTERPNLVQPGVRIPADLTSATQMAWRIAHINEWADNYTALGGPGAFEFEVIRLVNVERVAHGLTPLTGHCRLMFSARLKAQAMTDINYFSHYGAFGGPSDVILIFTRVTFATIGENIARGSRTPQEVVADWMSSPGHRDNMLNPNYVSMGVGATASASGEIKWVQHFGGEESIFGYPITGSNCSCIVCPMFAKWGIVSKNTPS